MVAAHQPKELTKLSQPNPGPRPEWSPCIIPIQICDTCESSIGEDGNVTITDKSHPGSMVVDGDVSSWWQSPPISRGLKYNRVTLDIDLQQVLM